MAEKKKRPIKITETVLRDAHQSLIATRMTTEQMLPIIDKMDKVGYHAVECWGGATFDASLRFLKEDPWERLRKLRDGFKNTKLQMLFRGQNILGYNHYADDVVEYFVQKSLANGIDIIRIFDCLNDIRNLPGCAPISIGACPLHFAHIQGFSNRIYDCLLSGLTANNTFSHQTPLLPVPNIYRGGSQRRSFNDAAGGISQNQPSVLHGAQITFHAQGIHQLHRKDIIQIALLPPASAFAFVIK